MKRIILICAIALLTVSEAHARFFYRPSVFASTINKVQPKVLTSNSGRYIFKIMPARAVVHNGTVKYARRTSGTAYKVLENGGFQQLWTIKDLPEIGARNRNVTGYHLLGDGNTLIIWQTAPRSHDEKVAIRVFNRGKLARGYAVKDFVSGKDFASGRMPRLSSGPTPWMNDEGTVINDKGYGFSFTTARKKWSFGFYQKPQ